jgi:hypothetical protein
MKDSNIKAIVKANYNSKQFLDHLLVKHDFSDEEKETIKTIQTHLINLSVIFNKINK